MLISRTPLRVSFVGGGSDLPAFSREHGGAVVSSTIDKYVYVILTERFEDGLRVGYSKTEIVNEAAELEHELVREALGATGLHQGLEIVTIADVPTRGTGLGSSSAVTIGLLNVLFAYQGLLKSPTELADAAARIEIDVLGKPIGRQDHYASAHGGFQFLRFGPGDRVDRHPIALPEASSSTLEQNLLMFYTGRQRPASDVLAEIGAEIKGEGPAPDRLAQMRDFAYELFEQFRNGADPDFVGRQLHRNWELKRELHSSVSSPEIDAWYQRALEAGALGGKVLGAGGGGFLLLYADPSRQREVRAALQGQRELHFRFETQGSRIVYVGR
jgi:Predicted kinase related to galactokinase and mevalonate kinase